MFVGTANGVHAYDPELASWTDMGLSGESIIGVLSYESGSLRAGGRSTLYTYSGSGTDWTSVPLLSFLQNYEIVGGANLSAIARTSTGDLLVGALHPTQRRGVNLLLVDDAGQVRNVVPDTPGGNNIIRLSVDPLDGSVWSSFWDFYVGKLKTNGAWINYNASIPESDSVTSRFVNTTCLADSRGSKWFSSLSVPTAPRPIDELRDQGDDDYANDVWTRRSLGAGGHDGLGSLRPQRAFEDPGGNIWFCNDDTHSPDGWWGIQIYNPTSDEWLQVTPSTMPGMATGNVSHVYFDGPFAYVAQRAFGVQRWAVGDFSWQTLKSLPSNWSPVAVLGVDPFTIDSTVEAVAVDPETGAHWIGTAGGVYHRFATSASFSRIVADNGFSSGLLSVKVSDLVLDHDGNAWVATEAGLNRINGSDPNDIESYTTLAAYQGLPAGVFPFDVIVPIAHANVRSLAMHPTESIVYVGTFGGLSVFDYSETSPSESPLTSVYVYPNPVYARKSHDELNIGGLNGPALLQVYNTEGELVFERSVEGAGAFWDLTARGGILVTSGVYYVRISNATGSVVKPFSIIR